MTVQIPRVAGRLPAFAYFAHASASGRRAGRALQAYDVSVIVSPKPEFGRWVYPGFPGVLRPSEDSRLGLVWLCHVPDES